jgi:signal transduction histidine kinase
MTGHFFLDWAIMAVSLINVILMLWLGVTVLLNAERRTWGVWLAGGGLLLGAAFFISHSAILGFGLDYGSTGLNLWWRIGWIPVVALPFVWYLVMLWYAGFWGNPNRPYLPNRQRSRVLLTSLLLVGLVGWLLVASPLPSFTQLVALQLSTVPTVGGTPLFLLIYALYIILCTSLALNVLRRPGPSARMMADQARHRARPWLMATSAIQLLVSLLVAGVIAWVFLNVRQGGLINRNPSLSTAIAWFDLVIAGLIAAAVISVGQAVVSYEVFTGKALPRRELQRMWRNAIILAVGYGLVIGWSFSLPVEAIYSLLLTTVLMTLFYALLSWRSFNWRERYIRHLRPFLASQHLYEHLLAPSTPTVPTTVDVTEPFRALCADVLEARLAYLTALGPLAPLVRPLVHPKNNEFPQNSLSELAATFHSPQTICVSLDPEQTGGAQWAVPLWSERGLIGVFLLGPKQDGGLYTQEEIEIARASGERLIDTRASTEIARRLMALQRQRLAESQILDQQARRVLHDDILPDLHAALLTLSTEADKGNKTTSEIITLLTDAHRRISDLLREMPGATMPTLTRLGLVGALRRVIADELADIFDTVAWQIEPEAEQAARMLPPLTAEVLFYAAREAIRNAAHHGRYEDSQEAFHLGIKLTAQDGLAISIEDNGVGMETTKPSNGGSGQGLALHSTMLAIVGGVLDVESVPKAYTRITIMLPQQTTSP